MCWNLKFPLTLCWSRIYWFLHIYGRIQWTSCALIDKVSFRNPQRSGDRRIDRQNLANMSHIKLDTYIDYFRFISLNQNKLTWQKTNQADETAKENESKINRKQLPKTQLHGLCINANQFLMWQTTWIQQVDFWETSCNLTRGV